MSTTIPQNTELLKKLAELLAAHLRVFSQERVFQNAALLLIAEIVAFARHTVTQLLMSIGRTKDDWSKFYRLFSCQRLPYDKLCQEFFRQTLEHVEVDQPYVVAGDDTQTPRSSRKMEGAHYLHNPTTPPFMRGIHVAQPWSHCSWLPPSMDGYTRAIPIRFVPAFTEKSAPTHATPRKDCKRHWTTCNGHGNSSTRRVAPNRSC